ncbi:MAG: ribose 1,5-bisphosphate isomerase [Candidatus Methanoplasma sp.]|nr:ribose 1,5-bisphosphate isomerase [Candidatus Methanoplasma sp.]
MTDIVADTADAIRDMKIRGAGRIARAAASAIGEFAAGYKGSSLEKFIADTDSAKARLLGSRPTAVSLWNGVYSSTKGIRSAGSFEEAKVSVIKDSKKFVDSSSKAVEFIARAGADRINNGDVILTHCNSSASVGVLKEAHRQGKNFRVYATETRPWRQGLITATELADAGIDVTLIVDSAVRTVMSKVDRVFVGADTITSDGSLVNKVGTSQIAVIAKEFGVEFNVCSETYKFSPKTILGEPVVIEEREREEVVKAGEVPDTVKVFNPVFDITPGTYISRIITEAGVLPPGAVYGTMIREFGDGIFELK